MIYVGSYRYANSCRKSNLWKFKNCYIFLKKYIVNDNCPYTIRGNSINVLHCKSRKARSYFDLLSLAEAHVNNFYKKDFDNSIRKLILKNKITFSFCPWIDTIVFKRGLLISTNIFYNNELKEYNYVSYNDFNTPIKKNLLSTLILENYLGFRKR